MKRLLLLCFTARSCGLRLEAAAAGRHGAAAAAPSGATPATRLHGPFRL